MYRYGGMTTQEFADATGSRRDRAGYASETTVEHAAKVWDRLGDAGLGSDVVVPALDEVAVDLPVQQPEGGQQ